MAAVRLRFWVMAVGLFLIIFQVETMVAGFPSALAGLADFRALYAAGYLVRTGHAASLYDYDFERQVQNNLVGARTEALPFIYPAYSALPFVPLSILPYRAAYLTFFAINLVLLFAACFVLRPYLPALSGLSPPLPAIVFLCFTPVAVALLQGQVSLLLLLLYCACYAALERDKPVLAGLLLSLALIKFHLALPVALLFAVWRYWRMVAAFIGGAIALALGSWALVGTSGSVAYLRSTFSATSLSPAAGAHPANGIFSHEIFSARMPNLYGLSYAVSHGAHWGAWLLVAASLAVLVWTALQAPLLPRAVVAALLVSYHLHMHDVSLLLLPLSLIFNQAVARHSDPPARRGASSSSIELDQSDPGQSLQLGAAALWMASPLLLWLMGRSWNALLALLMLPLLLSISPVSVSWMHRAEPLFLGKSGVEP